MKRGSPGEWAAVAAWALASVSAAGALTGFVRHAALVAIGFRVLTAWRLSVAAGALWRGEQERASVVRMAAAGSAVAHGALLCAAIGAATLGGTLPEPARLCALAERCTLVPGWTLPIALAGIGHAAWLWTQAGGNAPALFAHRAGARDLSFR